MRSSIKNSDQTLDNLRHKINQLQFEISKISSDVEFGVEGIDEDKNEHRLHQNQQKQNHDEDINDIFLFTKIDQDQYLAT